MYRKEIKNKINHIKNEKEKIIKIKEEDKPKIFQKIKKNNISKNIKNKKEEEEKEKNKRKK